MMQWKVVSLTAAIAFAISGVGFAQMSEDAEEERRMIDEVEHLTRALTDDLERVVDLIRQMRDRRGAPAADAPRTYTH